MDMRTVFLRAEADKLFNGPRTATSLYKALKLLNECRGLLAKLNLSEIIRGSQPIDHGFGPVLPPSEKLNGQQDGGPVTFPNIWIASKQLHCYTLRIILAGLMARCTRWICQPGGCESTPQYETALESGKQDIENVISCIPYFLSWSDKGTTAVNATFGTTDHPEGLASVLYLQPMLAAGLSEFSTLEQKICIRDFMTQVQGRSGIKQAEVLSRVSPLNATQR